MNDKIKKLMEERAKCVTDMRALLDAAEKDSAGVLSTEKEDEYRKLEERQENLKKQVDRESRAADLQREMETTVTERAKVNSGSEVADGDKQKELHLRATRDYIKYGLSAVKQEEYRALSAGSMTEGGAFIPAEQFVNELIKAVDDQVAMRQLSRVFKLSKAQTLGAPVLDADPADADWTTELATGSEDSTMKAGKRELKPNPIAKRIKESETLMLNSVINVESLIAERLGYKFGITEEKAFLTGSGASQPLGVMTASAMGIPTSRDVSTGNTTTDPTFDGLIECFGSLKEAYQKIATWMFHRNTVTKIRKLKDGEGQYLWQPSLVSGSPDTILGRPVRQSEYMPNTYTTGLYVGIVGDFSKYWIAESLSMQLKRLVELYAETNQIGFIGRMEVDGMPVVAEAFARVKLA